MYSLAIYLYVWCVRLAALWNRKARLMVQGHRNTWRLLRHTDGGGYVWFHAASLGEFEQGRPLMERLRREQPERKILLTFFSPSGYEVRKNYEGADLVCYLPFDTPFNARRFVRLVRPEAAFFIKYEFWRNYIEVLSREGTPCYSVSSIFRPDQIFFRPYGRGYARVLRRLTHLFVQNEASARLLSERLGLTSVSVVGDTRMDRVIDIMHEAAPLPAARAFAQGAPHVLVAGSTWPPDEDLLIHYFNNHPTWKLILAPHVVSEEHLQQIERKLRRPAVRYTRLCASGLDEGAAAAAHCLIVDCYGLLSALYRYGHVAYVGGGFGVGIHNVPEAAVYGMPVLFGPRHAKFREANDLLRLGGAVEVGSQADLDTTLDRFAEQPDALSRTGRAAGSYISRSAGATERIYSAVFGPAPHQPGDPRPKLPPRAEHLGASGAENAGKSEEAGKAAK